MLLGAEALCSRALAAAPLYAEAVPAGPTLCVLSVALRRPDGSAVVGATVRAEPLLRFIGGWYVADLALSTTTNAAGVASMTLVAGGAGVFAWRVRAFDGADLLLDREAETPAGVAVLRAVARVPRLH